MLYRIRYSVLYSYILVCIRWIRWIMSFGSDMTKMRLIRLVAWFLHELALMMQNCRAHPTLCTTEGAPVERGEGEHERELISATWPDPDPDPQCRGVYEAGVCVVAGVSVLPQPYPSWQRERQRERRSERQRERERPSPWWPAAVDRRMTVGRLMLASSSFSPGHPFHPNHPLPSLPHPIIIIIMGPISRRVMQMAPPNTKTQRRRQNTHRTKRTEST